MNHIVFSERDYTMKVLQVISKILCLCIKYMIYRFERSGNVNLDCSLWGLKVTQRGHLVIGECDCVELVKEYGTPLHIVDKNLLQKNYDEFYESFEFHNIDFEIYYSYKTNPIPGIIKLLHESGAGAEVISPYELWLALKLGVNPDLIIYNGPNKSYEGLKLAVERGIKLININSFSEIGEIERIARRSEMKTKVGVRICTSVGWGNQFGFKIKSGEAFKAFEKLAKIDCIETSAIHVHLGSGIKSTSIYETAIENIFEFINIVKDKLGISIKYLDLGGGFGVSTVKVFGKIESKLHSFFNKPYIPPDIANTPSINEFANEIVNTVQKECDRYKLKLPVLLFEPGRVITSNSQILLAKIGDLKKASNGDEIALVDVGVNIAYPMNWEYHEIFVANKMNSNLNAFYDIAGPICTPADIISKSKKLPLLEVGDIISIMDVGAYFTSFSNNFSFPRPAVIMASEGRHCVLRHKESYEDMISLDNF